jgi:hypothetical protein
MVPIALAPSSRELEMIMETENYQGSFLAESLITKRHLMKKLAG